MVLRYLEALGGAEADRGWSMLGEAARESNPDEDRYLLVARSAGGPPTIEDVELTHEDDGFYAFTVSYSGRLDDAYAQTLFTSASGQASPIACPNGPDQFEIAVIIGDSEFAGITQNSCVDGQLRDPRE